MIVRVRRGLRRNESGTVTIELALIAPVFFMLMFGIIEYSLVMFGTAVLESATSNTARMGKTGYTEEGVTRQDMLYEMVRTKAGGLLDAEKLEITTQVYGGFSDVREPEPYNDQNGNGTYESSEPYTDINGNGQWDSDMGAAGLGGAGEVVVYTVRYPWSVITPGIRQILGNDDGNFIMQSSIVVRNEPYDVTGLGN